MSRREKLYDAPASKKARGEEVAKKGDVKKFEDDDDEWESQGEAWLDEKGEPKTDVDPAQKWKPGDLKDPLRVHDSEGGRRREYWRRKPAVPTS